jgi:hypothetical protein
MASLGTPQGLIRFGPFALDPTSRELRKRGHLIRLQPQQFAVLLLLIERAGQVVSREEIHQHIWGNDTFVDFERGINFSIDQIRAALGDDADKPRYVERFWDYARSLENAFSLLWLNRKMGNPEVRFLRVFPGRWTLVRSAAENRNNLSLCAGKMSFLDASPLLQLGRGKRYIHGQGAAKHFMQKVLVAVLREDDLTAAGRRVIRLSCGKCMEAPVLASDHDRALRRVVADLIAPRGKHQVANGEVERNLEHRCLGTCASAAHRDHRDQGCRKICEYRSAFHGGSPFRGHLSIAVASHQTASCTEQSMTVLLVLSSQDVSD